MQAQEVQFPARYRLGWLWCRCRICQQQRDPHREPVAGRNHVRGFEHRIGKSACFG